MRLPQIPVNIQKSASEMVQMRGINFSDALQDGDLADSLNISARRHPYITARRARAQMEGAAYAGATALTAWGELVSVVGTDIYVGGVQVPGSVTPGEKQFAVVNTKLVIWPDKKYIDLNTRTLADLGASKSGSKASFSSTYLQVTWPNCDFTQIFRPGDTVTISGASIAANNISFNIKEVAAKKLTAASEIFTGGTATGTITIAREIPDLDFICESENRLWGCSSSARTIYASALGDPTNFFTYEGLATDAYAVAVGSEGAFTGCCKLSSSVLFFKETTLHKILGSYPAEYSMYSYTLEGLRAGCHKSLQVINETLFYLGLHGVYAFSGGTPTLVSGNFGEKVFTDGVAGNDGDTYYLSAMSGGTPYLFAYETTRGLWVLEDYVRATDFARIGKDLYFLDDAGGVWLEDSGQEDEGIEWRAQFTPFYETIQGRKSYSKIILRVQLPKGSWLIAEVRTDGQPWEEVGRLYGDMVDARYMRIALNRCDKFELKLSGKGPFTILSILREFSLGSDA